MWLLVYGALAIVTYHLHYCILADLDVVVLDCIEPYLVQLFACLVFDHAQIYDRYDSLDQAHVNQLFISLLDGRGAYAYLP